MPGHYNAAPQNHHYGKRKGESVKQERMDLLKDNPVVRDMTSNRPWMSKHFKSTMGSAVRMDHEGSPATAAKPDFPDIDGDGNTSESMKQAAKDKKAKGPEMKMDGMSMKYGGPDMKYSGPDMKYGGPDMKYGVEMKDDSKGMEMKKHGDGPGMHTPMHNQQIKVVKKVYPKKKKKATAPRREAQTRV